MRGQVTPGGSIGKRSDREGRTGRDGVSSGRALPWALRLSLCALGVVGPHPCTVPLRGSWAVVHPPASIRHGVRGCSPAQVQVQHLRVWAWGTGRHHSILCTRQSEGGSAQPGCRPAAPGDAVLGAGPPPPPETEVGRCLLGAPRAQCRLGLTSALCLAAS